MRLVSLSVLLLMISIVVVAGCVSTESVKTSQQTQKQFVNDRNESVSGNYVVTITKDGFQPQEITISLGSTVIWNNKDTKPQTVYIDTLKKGSVAINPDRSWPYTFNVSGEYDYHSSFYTSLKGRVIVR